MEPTVAGLTVFPIKSLDGDTRDRVTVAPGGSLAGDREYAVVDADGTYVNGKRTAAVHRVRSSVDRDAGTVTLRDGQSDARTFDLDGRAVAEWFSAAFDVPVSLCRDPTGQPDDTDAHGTTVVSTATLRAVASWFPDCTLEGVRRRFRANVEVGGVSPFWEESLVGETVRLGDARLRVTGSCRRCVVPTRDPDTGAPTSGFRQRFVRRREASAPPATADGGAYRLTVNTSVPESSWGASIGVGDAVERGGDSA